jgi:hypothetical protein
VKDFCCGPDTRRRDDDERRFVAAVLGNPFVGEILERMRGIALPHWYLTGGCLFQTVWNGAHGLPAATGILDWPRLQVLPWPDAPPAAPPPGASTS